MEVLKQHIEALVFVAEQSITPKEIAESLKNAFGWELTGEQVIEQLESLRGRYESEEYAFEMVEIGGGYQFMTKKDYYPAVQSLLQTRSKKKLSTAALETLSIIAYKQPVTRAEIEHIRGVSCDYSIQKLLEKELIEINGRSEGPGKSMVYVTSKSFMDYFGLKSVKDLPQLKDIQVADENTIGVAQE